MLVLSSIIGTLPAWLTVAGVVSAAWYFRRGGGGAALDTLETANRILDKRVHELSDQLGTAQKQLMELQGRTDVGLALAPVLAWTDTHERRAQERHESAQARAQERHVALLNVLEMIAERLGPDPNGGNGEHRAAAA